jgi:hypothetical protein
VPHRELDLTVGELSPVLDGRCELSLRRLIEDFANFQACSADTLKER